VPLLGAGPIFPTVSHSALSWQELVCCLVVGLAAGIGSGILTWMVYTAEDAFAKLPFHYMWWPVIGGLCVGLGGLLYPRALGVGYDTIGDLLAGHLSGSFLIGLMGTKALIWAIALGSGTSGGVLAPLLIMGGALGSLESGWLGVGDTGLWAMIGMAAMMGGTMRSPLTAVAFVLELTDDIRVLPGLLIACATAHAFTVLVMKRSILTEKVARRGYHVMREYIVNPLARVRVQDVMERDAPTLPADQKLDVVLRRLAAHDQVLGRRYAWPLVDASGKLKGIVTRGDLVRVLEAEGSEDMTLLQAGTSKLVVAYPDELLEVAVDRMVRHDIGRLPVVDPADPTVLLGYLGRTGIARGWRQIFEEERIRDEGWLMPRKNRQPA
jgi:chloride channel protein, CIC family